MFCSYKDWIYWVLREATQIVEKIISDYCRLFDVPALNLTVSNFGRYILK